jgi:uncharacterized protein (TIGR02145 family)
MYAMFYKNQVGLLVFISLIWMSLTSSCFADGVYGDKEIELYWRSDSLPTKYDNFLEVARNTENNWVIEHNFRISTKKIKSVASNAKVQFKILTKKQQKQLKAEISRMDNTQLQTLINEIDANIAKIVAKKIKGAKDRKNMRILEDKKTLMLERMDFNESTVTNEILPSRQTGWNLMDGWDCSSVDNAIWKDWSVSTCKDNRTYTHIGSGATHSQIYRLLKIEGRWWFNQNLAYPLSDNVYREFYRKNDGKGLYSCPWHVFDGFDDVLDCPLVSTFWYLYQWNAVMAWDASTNIQVDRSKGICPIGWAVPTKLDFTSWSWGFWPVRDSSLHEMNLPMYSNNWNVSFVGYRDSSQMMSFKHTGLKEYFWSSSELDQDVASRIVFDKESNMVKSTYIQRQEASKANFYSVRCIKN